MRIGIFTDTYLPVSNGICYVIDIIKKDLEADGHEVFIFAPQNLFKKQPPEKHIIRYKALQGLLYSDQFFSFFWPSRQLKKMKDLNLDAVMIFTPSLIGGLGAYAALRLDIPYVVQYGTDMEAYAEKYKLTTIVGVFGTVLLAPHFLRLGLAGTLRFYKSFFSSRNGDNYWRFMVRTMITPMHERAAAIIATSDKTARQLRNWQINQCIETIPTGVNALEIQPGKTKDLASKYGIDAADQVILYAGRLSVEKNIEKLIEAFPAIYKKCPDAKLLLVGDFQHRHRLEALADSSGHGERIIFTGLLERKDLGSIYSLAQVFAFPSTTDCQALVLNEAAHAGLPLVWCDTPELNPVLQDGITGLRAKNSKKDLAAKLLSLLENDKRRKEYGRRARSAARNFSETAQTKKIEKLLREVCKA